MAKSFKFRHVNEIAGGFVLAVVAMLIGAVALMAVSQGWFVRTQWITLQLPREGSQGLKEGADVSILGNIVGSVRTLRVTESGRMEADLKVRSDFAKFIGQGSEAWIRRTLGFGDAYVEITKGTGGPPPPGLVIEAKAEQSATTLAEKTITDIRDQVVPTLKEAQSALAEYRGLAADLRKPDGSLQTALGHINAVTAKVEGGQGLAGKLLSDPALADQASGAITKVNAAIDEFQGVLKDLHKATANLSEQSQAMLKETQSILADVRKITATLPDTTRSISRTAESLPGLVLQVQETMRQTQRLVEALQRSFLVRGSVAPDTTGARLRPEDIGSGGR